MVNKIRLVLLILVVFISTLFIFTNGYLFCLFFVVKNYAVQDSSNVKWRLLSATLYEPAHRLFLVVFCRRTHCWSHGQLMKSLAT